MSGSEDGCLKIWHATTYRLENTLNYAFERCWSIAALKGTNNVAIGYDEGTVAIQLGNEVRFHAAPVPFFFCCCRGCSGGMAAAAVPLPPRPRPNARKLCDSRL